MRLLIAAGGTGGHVFPAVAVAKMVKRLEPHTHVLFVGVPKGFETHWIKKCGLPLVILRVGPLKGLSMMEKIKGLFSIPAALIGAWVVITRYSPHVVLGIGGYASGPLLLVAALRGRRTAIVEPNAVAGFSNRVLGHLVGRIYCAFDEAMSKFPKRKCFVTGNPIREEILRIPPPRFEHSRRTILIFGGSQGARSINEAVLSMLPFLGHCRERFFFLHQTGVCDHKAVTQAYEQQGCQASVKVFLDPMSEAYEQSDLIIARSGSSVLEIAACGRPSILIPYPYAADNHQQANAKIMEGLGASVIVKQEDLSGERLAHWVLTLTGDVSVLEKMSGAALSLRKEHAARQIASELIAGGKEA